MKKLLLIGLLLGSQLSYASHDETCLSPSRKATALVLVGYSVMTVGIVLIKFGVDTSSKDYNLAAYCGLAGGTACILAGSCMGYSCALSNNQNAIEQRRTWRDTVETESVDTEDLMQPRLTRSRLQNSLLQNLHGDEQV